METVVLGRKQKHAQRGDPGLGAAGSAAPPVDMAETWMKKVDGKIHQLVVKKLEATWSGPWMYNEDTDDWEAMTSSLAKNLNANALALALEDDGEGMLRVV
jgi:hypothetical protein